VCCPIGDLDVTGLGSDVRRDPVTGDVILSRRPDSWHDFFDLTSMLDSPDDFLANRRDPPPQKTEAFLMPVRYFLDTNMASYAIKGNVPHARERLSRVPMAEVGISVMTEAELRFGGARKPGHSRLETAVEEFLLRVEALRWDSAAAKC
jgi:PIN domain